MNSTLRTKTCVGFQIDEWGYKFVADKHKAGILAHAFEKLFSPKTSPFEALFLPHVVAS